MMLREPHLPSHPGSSDPGKGLLYLLHGCFNRAYGADDFTLRHQQVLVRERHCATQHHTDCRADELDQSDVVAEEFGNAGHFRQVRCAKQDHDPLPVELSHLSTRQLWHADSAIIAPYARDYARYPQGLRNHNTATDGCGVPCQRGAP